MFESDLKTIIFLVAAGIICITVAAGVSAEEYLMNETTHLSIYVDNMTVYINDSDDNFYVKTTARSEPYYRQWDFVCNSKIINVTQCDVNSLAARVPSNETIKNMFRDEIIPMTNEIESYIQNMQPLRNETDSLRIDYAKCLKDLEIKQKDIDAEAAACQAVKMERDEKITDKNNLQKMYDDQVWDVRAAWLFIALLVCYIATDGFKSLPWGSWGSNGA